MINSNNGSVFIYMLKSSAKILYTPSICSTPKNSRHFVRALARLAQCGYRDVYLLAFFTLVLRINIILPSVEENGAFEKKHTIH